jgi:hypothetical protein
MSDKEVKKCLVCSMFTVHKFKDCCSTNCECNCLQEIRGEVPLPIEECPRWFRVVTRKDAQRFHRIHSKKGN